MIAAPISENGNIRPGIRIAIKAMNPTSEILAMKIEYLVFISEFAAEYLILPTVDIIRIMNDEIIFSSRVPLILSVNF
jgi:hypothetical protein